VDVLIVGVLLATVVLRFVLIVAFAYLVFPRGLECPHCATPLEQVEAGWWSVVTGLERRFCLECGWTGLVRHRRRPAVSGPAGPA
jgi:hypothetical protein